MKQAFVHILKAYVSLFLFVFGCAASGIKSLQHASSFNLKNGLQVIVIPNHKAPVVSHALWVKAGSSDDPYGTSGIAHFLEHLLLKGASPGVPEDKLMDLFSDLGADHNAMTAQSFTVYYENLPRKHLERVLATIAPRIRGLEISRGAVDSERKVIIEERSMSYDNLPERQLIEALLRALYWHHPNGINGIGWRHEMERLSYEDVMTFYDRYYSPENMVLILAGDITLKDAKALVEKYYADIPKSPKFKPTLVLKEPPHHGVRQHLTKTDLRIKHRVFYYTGLMDYNRDAKMTFRETVAFEVLMYLLSNDVLGYAYEHFVREKKHATHIGISSNMLTKYQPYLMCVLTPKAGLTSETLIKEWDTFLQTLPTKIQEDHLEKAKTRLVKTEKVKSDSVLYGGFAVGDYLVAGYTLDDVKSWAQVLESLSLDEIKAVAHKIAAIPNSKFGVVTAEALPEGGASAQDSGPSLAAVLPTKGLN